jgi:hypothetical protein
MPPLVMQYKIVSTSKQDFDSGLLDSFLTLATGWLFKKNPPKKNHFLVHLRRIVRRLGRQLSTLDAISWENFLGTRFEPR